MTKIRVAQTIHAALEEVGFFKKEPTGKELQDALAKHLYEIPAADGEWPIKLQANNKATDGKLTITGNRWLVVFRNPWSSGSTQTFYGAIKPVESEEDEENE